MDGNLSLVIHLPQARAAALTVAGTCQAQNIIEALRLLGHVNPQPGHLSFEGVPLQPPTNLLQMNVPDHSILTFRYDEPQQPSEPTTVTTSHEQRNPEDFRHISTGISPMETLAAEGSLLDVTLFFHSDLDGQLNVQEIGRAHV